MIITWSKGAADDCMPEEMLVGTLEKVRRHPWWRARARLALAALRTNGIQPPMSVLDVGCGWGVNLDALEAAGYDATGLDISPRILKLIDRRDRHLVEADLSQLPSSKTDLYDGLLVLDVIEHLDDDRGALSAVSKLAHSGGVVIVSVPALPELYSEFDRLQGHRRRYLPETLRAAFEGSDLIVRKIFWWGAWMVPVLRCTRTDGNQRTTNRAYADYLSLPPWPIPSLMSLAYAWEEKRAINGKLRTGTSLFAVGTRRD